MSAIKERESVSVWTTNHILVVTLVILFQISTPKHVSMKLSWGSVIFPLGELGFWIKMVACLSVHCKRRANWTATISQELAREEHISTELPTISQERLLLLR